MSNWPTDLQPESTWTKPSDWCPRPDRWHATDDDSTEAEVTALVHGFVRALQPDIVVETGTAWGQTAASIGRALRENGHGVLHTWETDVQRVNASRQRCQDLPVIVEWESSIIGLTEWRDDDRRPIDFAWLDSLFDLRVQELDLLRPVLAPGAIVGIHDTGPKHPLRAMLVDAGLFHQFYAINLHTPRGVMFLQKVGEQ